jgi:hypothetical protein
MPLVESEKAELFYETIGEGPVVTFAHGAGGNTGFSVRNYWRK